MDTPSQVDLQEQSAPPAQNCSQTPVNDGGSAYPIMPPADSQGVVAGYPFPERGLSIRDYFAAKAMASPLMGKMIELRIHADANNGAKRFRIEWGIIAADAYAIADAMLAARAGGAAEAIDNEAWLGTDAPTKDRIAAIIRTHLGDPAALRQSHAELVEALERAKLYVQHEHEMAISARGDHQCGPDRGCDHDCMTFATLSEDYHKVRTALQHAKEVTP